MAGFTQVIEFRTSRFDEIQAMNEQWRQSHPQPGPSRIMITKDRDQEDVYVSVVEFSSYEEAVRNSEDPDTTEWAGRMAALCDGEPVFRNLDVVMTEVRINAQRQPMGSMTDA